VKLPTEGELIEMEHRLSSLIARSERILRRDDPYADWPERFDQLREDFDCLISLARDPSQLLKYVPFDDDALDRAMHPPRTSVSKPFPIARPKPKKAKR
jgi:hypothetical protein